jgi:hypothetical protein
LLLNFPSQTCDEQHRPRRVAARNKSHNFAQALTPSCHGPWCILHSTNGGCPCTTGSSVATPSRQSTNC